MIEEDDYTFVNSNSSSFNEVGSYKNSEEEDPYEMSIIDWLKILIVTAIPCLGFIMLFVWAFSKNNNPNVTNYAKASLVVLAVAVAIYLFLVMFGVLGVLLAI